MGAAIAAVPAGVLILAGNNSGRAAFDATAYHERYIRDLAATFPSLDYSNPLTATTPGYHTLLAAFAWAGGSSTTALRLASLAIGCAFVGLVASWVARRIGTWSSVALVVPLSMSIYVMGSNAWVLPDNLAWLLVTSILMLALRDRQTVRSLVFAGLLTAALVFVRQIHLWAAAIVWCAGILDGWSRSDPHRRWTDRVFATAPRALLAFAATIPAFLVIVAFVRHWGGVVPPRFQTELQSVNGATPAFILLQFAILWIGFSPWLWHTVVSAWRVHRPIVLAAAGLGITLALVPVTTEDAAAGRFSGWWQVVGQMPVLFGRTGLPIAVGAPAGAVLLAAALLAVEPRRRLLLVGSIAAFVAALSSNIYAWQRYHEPLLLVLLPILCALVRPATVGRPLSWMRATGPILLGVFLGLVAFRGFQGERVPENATPSERHRMPGERFSGE